MDRIDILMKAFILHSVASVGISWEDGMQH